MSKIPVNILEKSKTKISNSNIKNSTFNFWSEFKTFAVKGDVIELAVAIIIGASFNTIVQSLVNDIVMPIFGKILGRIAFSEIYINLSDQSFNTLQEAILSGAPVIKIGLFITNIVNFLIVALTIFIVLKYFLRYKSVKN